MCGIAGGVWSNPAMEVTRNTLGRMTDAIAHRGPDAEGHWIQPATESSAGVALGHRRLSIIDVAGSSQPLGNEDGRIQVVFNGEIYNYKELRRRT